MTDRKPPTALTDPDNVMFVEVEDEQAKQGMSVEDAYRHLAGLSPEPVEVPEEI